MVFLITNDIIMAKMVEIQCTYLSHVQYLKHNRIISYALVKIYNNMQRSPFC